MYDIVPSFSFVLFYFQKKYSEFSLLTTSLHDAKVDRHDIKLPVVQQYGQLLPLRSLSGEGVC